MISMNTRRRSKVRERIENIDAETLAAVLDDHYESAIGSPRLDDPSVARVLAACASREWLIEGIRELIKSTHERNPTLDGPPLFRTRSGMFSPYRRDVCGMSRCVGTGTCRCT